MDDNTIRAAIQALHLRIPETVSRDSEKYRSEQGAAKNMRWIVHELVECYDNKKRPPSGLLYALRGLSNVADLTQQAADLNTNIRDEHEDSNYKRKRKEAQDALLDCFGLLAEKGAPSEDRQKIISDMAMLLCPPLNDDLEPIGKPDCDSIKAAATKVGKSLGISPRTAQRAWSEYESDLFIE